MLVFKKLFSLFIIYSFIGWIIEVFWSLFVHKKLVNRGFLIGPYCPIYGIGCLLLIILLNRFKSNVIVLFFMSIVVCSFLEYFTSYLMEVVFKTRWWDYSTKKFNINGRICLGTMIPFGILGCFLVYLINPFLINIISFWDIKMIKILALVVFMLYLIDNILSFNIIFKIRDTITNIEKDSTEEISNKVKLVFQKRGGLYRRLINAFPNMMSPKERLLAIKAKINADLEKFDVRKKK